MLISLLLHLPLWATIPGYFLVGVLWALFYLPRSLKEQAARYQVWRNSLLDGRPLDAVLGQSTRQEHGKLTSCTPSDFLSWRNRRTKGYFTENSFIGGFIVNIAFWPIRIIEKLLFVYLREVWRALREVWHAIRRWCRYVWDHVIVAFCRWVYRGMIRVYQRIIARANREAIEDLAFVKQATDKEHQQ